MNLFTKTLAAGAAALTLAIAFAPAAEARPGHGWGGGWGGGYGGGYGHRWPGYRHGGYGLIGIGYGGYDGGYDGGCFVKRVRVFDQYRGRFVMVRRTVCN